eukprot:sb/3463454/
MAEWLEKVVIRIVCYVLTLLYMRPKHSLTRQRFPRRMAEPERRLTPPDGDDLLSGLTEQTRLKPRQYKSNKSPRDQPTLLQAAVRDDPPEKPPAATPNPSPASTPPPDGYENTGIYDVNDVIERAGFGYYQLKAVIVIAIMSFADAAEIWLATLIVNNLQCEWNLTSFEKATIPAIVYLFYAFGSMMSGYMADKIGRYWVLIINSYILIISAIASALSPSYVIFLICRATTGFCIGGNYGCSIVYIQEMVPIRYRSVNMFFFELVFGFGAIFECALAYFVMGWHQGWRYQVMFTVAPIIIMLVFMHFLDESPRYLVINNKKEEAQRVIAKMYRENKVEPLKGDLYIREERSGGMVDVWASPHTWGSIQLSIHFLSGTTAPSACSLRPPGWIQRRASDGEYLFLIVTNLACYPGFFAATWLADCVGRKPAMMVSVYGGAVSTVLLLFCFNSYVTYVELAACVIFYSAYNQVLWIYTPEFYATYMRGTAIGVQNGLGKFGAAAGTFLTTYLMEVNIAYCIGCFVGVQVVSCLTVTFLKKETQGQVMQDGREVGENSRITSGGPEITKYGSE